MANTAPDVALLGLFDRFAYQKEACIQAVAGGTDVWDRVDASGDETFENRVKGSDATALDTEMGVISLGEIKDMSTFLSDISSYCSSDLGYSGFDAYLTARKFRIDLRTAQIWQEAFGSATITASNIASRSDMVAAIPGLSLGTMVGDGSGTGSYPAGTDMSETTNGPSPIHARVTKKGSTDWAMTVTCKQATGLTPTTEDVIITVGSSVAVATKYIVGETLQDENNAADQKVVKVAATAQFAVGQTVLLSQWTADSPSRVWVSQETAVVASIDDGVSLTMTADLLHAYTTAGGRTFVYPCYIGVSDCDDATGDDGTNLDAVTFYPAPERTLKL